jgi:hypothetical protein
LVEDGFGGVLSRDVVAATPKGPRGRIVPWLPALDQSTVSMRRSAYATESKASLVARRGTCRA